MEILAPAGDFSLVKKILTNASCLTLSAGALRSWVTCALCVMPYASKAWGFFAHKEINRMAVFSVPQGSLLAFYKQNIEFLTEHAVDADKRRYAVKEEACRHYIDADHYEKAPPIDSIPKWWKDAVAKYSEDTLNAYGIVPWHINSMVYRLTAAFKEKNIRQILRLSADLGHYAADAHVPLHSTQNYNGQMTDQHGIHGLWESRLPELFAEEYDFFSGPATYLADVQGFAWHASQGSFAALDSVLRFEKQLSQVFPADRKYAFEARGQTTVKVFSREFSNAYHQMLSGMVERRMKASVHAVACLWYTAWVNAGMPVLGEIPEPADAGEQEKEAEQERRFREGLIIGRPEPED